jgi:hypothetical protein
VRILGECNRGNYIPQYQIKKIPNFPEFEKNLVPPAMPLKSKTMWGRCGENCGESVGRYFLKCGESLGKVHIDGEGWGRKFLGHATLFLMVPKC